MLLAKGRSAVVLFANRVDSPTLLKEISKTTYCNKRKKYVTQLIRVLTEIDVTCKEEY